MSSTARARPPREPAERRPVARVSVDVGLAHLDRPFDYLVPAALSEDVVPGSRVRVRFAGRLVDGLVLSRVDRSEHGGRLAFLERATSAEPVLAPEIAELARVVADRYAGTLSDVLRLAVPPRHARVEKDAPGTSATAPGRPAGQRWTAYRAGGAFLTAVGRGDPARAAWTALPGEDWPARLAEVAQAALSAGRGAALVVPDARDIDRVDAALLAALGPGRHVALSAGLGPAERYRRWLAVRRGQVRAVVGPRSAAFAPVADLGVAVVWDVGDDLHAEPRAPYPHVREVLLERTRLAGAALLVGGFARTAEVAQLVGSGWLQPVQADRTAVRRAAPRVVALGDDAEAARDPGARSARLPSLAFRAAREALADGAPVLVQVPRRGYVPALACGRCRAPARCSYCQGPLAQPGGGDAVPACRWCGRLAAIWACPVCGDRRLRASVVGARRTAEELGRAFPGATVLTSGRDGVLAAVPDGPSLVVSTPGAEPVAPGGYGTALLLDGWAPLSRPDLRAAEEAVRRWLAAATLVRPADAGGRVVLLAAAELRAVQAVVRWDPVWHADLELAERVDLGFPPAVRMASITGQPGAVEEVADLVTVDGVQRLGPVPAGESGVRLLLRVPRSVSPALARALAQAQGVRSARKATDPVRVQIDPLDLL